ncbi:hypothetical protein [Pseudoalteromonas sp. S2755]|uniref:hypothetical protein n=1 Tax=Pseudoalteromonas sp. S2755 TaxID=2066523 RepID=UPI00110B08DF|nr:hypothetical protein [Pseudoalteromonas sp. S2755]TMN34501.1 hypothetical protein CWC03_16515 [Pseudoalteromonas sp. S2755]
MNVNFLIHSPTQPAESQDELEPKAEETAEPNQFRLSEKDMSKLSGEEVREKQEEAALPPHIQKMVEKLEELREKIKEEQKLLEELKINDAYSDEMKAELVTQKLEFILRMQSQVIELTKNIQEALKEAGITDPGVLLKALA